MNVTDERSLIVASTGRLAFPPANWWLSGNELGLIAEVTGEGFPMPHKANGGAPTSLNADTVWLKYNLNK